MSTTGRDRRRHDRFPAIEIHCVFPRGLGGYEGVVSETPIVGRVTDIGRGGARIEVRSKFALQVLDQKSMFDIELSKGERRLSVRAMIAWRLVDDKKGVCFFGVFFAEELDEEVLTLLRS